MDEAEVARIIALLGTRVVAPRRLRPPLLFGVSTLFRERKDWQLLLLAALGCNALLVVRVFPSSWQAVWAAIGGAFILWRWQAAQRQKQMAQVLERIRAFDETPGTLNAITILSAPATHVGLYDPKASLKDRYVDVTWDEARWAILPSVFYSSGDRKSVAIRSSFGDFLNRMDQIAIWVRSGVIDFETVRPLVQPWAIRFAGGVNDSGLSRNLRIWLHEGHRFSIQQLCLQCGIDITPSRQDYILMEAELGEFLADLDIGRFERGRIRRVHSQAIEQQQVASDAAD